MSSDRCSTNGEAARSSLSLSILILQYCGRLQLYSNGLPQMENQLSKGQFHDQ